MPFSKDLQDKLKYLSELPRAKDLSAFMCICQLIPQKFSHKQQCKLMIILRIFTSYESSPGKYLIFLCLTTTSTHQFGFLVSRKVHQKADVSTCSKHFQVQSRDSSQTFSERPASNSENLYQGLTPVIILNKPRTGK